MFLFTSFILKNGWNFRIMFYVSEWIVVFLCTTAVQMGRDCYFVNAHKVNGYGLIAFLFSVKIPQELEE